MPTANQIKMAKVRAARGKPKKQKGGCDGDKSCKPCMKGKGMKIGAVKAAVRKERANPTKPVHTKVAEFLQQGEGSKLEAATAKLNKDLKRKKRNPDAGRIPLKKQARGPLVVDKEIRAAFGQEGEGPKIDALKKVGRAVAGAAVKGVKLAVKHRKDIAKGIKIAGTVGKAIAPKIKVFDFADAAADVIGSGQKGKGISQRSKYAGKNTGMLTDPTASQGVGGMTAITGRLTF